MRTLTPLVVDLDGTLISTDSLIESAILLIKKNPVFIFHMFYWLSKGKAYLKTEISRRTLLDVETLPYIIPFVHWLKNEKEKDRQIYLVTAAHKTIAERVAKHLGIFDGYFATDVHSNLKGIAKCELIKKEIGDKFVYAGDSRADIPVWENAEAAVLVHASRQVTSKIRDSRPIEAEFPKEKTSLKIWFKALRVHQWVKNSLLFVPLLTAFEFLDIYKVCSVLLAFLAYSFLSSGTYILNDIWDLTADRLHTRKRNRPFACGKIAIPHGFLMAAILFVLSLSIGCLISTAFVAILIMYFFTTSVYSLVFKQHALVDTILLSLLYTLRIFAGVIVIEVSISSWMIAFSMFLFLSLALIKRCGELVSLENEEQKEAITGRDYGVADLRVLWPLGVGAALAAIVVLGLFISAPETQQRYASPELLWCIALGIMYWLGRLWLKTSRGKMHDDPIVFVMTDSVSYILLLSIIIVTVIAHFYTLPFKVS